MIRSTPSSPRWAGTPICPSSVSAARSPNSEAGTTHASRLRVRNASLVHDWTARYPDFPQPVARLKAAHVWAWPDVEACALLINSAWFSEVGRSGQHVGVKSIADATPENGSTMNSKASFTTWKTPLPWLQIGAVAGTVPSPLRPHVATHSGRLTNSLPLQPSWREMRLTLQHHLPITVHPDPDQCQRREESGGERNKSHSAGVPGRSTCGLVGRLAPVFGDGGPRAAAAT